MLTFACGIFLIVILVVVHEMGHLLAARVCGVGVESFSIGFGPGFKMFTLKGIPFYFRFILLGGYVRLKSRNQRNAESDGKCLEEAGWKQKIFIFVAGIGFNLITAVILRTLIFWFAPADTRVQIFAINLRFAPISAWYLAPFYAVFLTFKMFVMDFLGLIAGIWFMILPLVKVQPIAGGGVEGMVGLGANAHLGVWSYCGLLYVISVLLAAMNILPLVPFDGGHIAITLINRVFGDNRFSRFVAKAITVVGIIILVVLLLNMLMSDGSDFYRFIRRK